KTIFMQGNMLQKWVVLEEIGVGREHFRHEESVEGEGHGDCLVALNVLRLQSILRQRSFVLEDELDVHLEILRTRVQISEAVLPRVALGGDIVEGDALADVEDETGRATLERARKRATL
ncbi:hypothetical protein PMAYCL1PPCAC_03951, partial [Pristionchus mayeri]